MAENSNKRTAVIKRKQMMVLGGVAAVILFLSVGMSVWMQPAHKEPVGPENQPKTRQLQLGGTGADKEAWRAQSQAEMDKFRKTIDELQQAESNRQAKEKSDKDRAAAEAAMAAEREKRTGTSAGYGSPVAPPEPPPGTPRTGMFTMGGVTGERGAPGPMKAPPAGSANTSVVSQQGTSTSGIKQVSFDDDGDSADGAAPGEGGLKGEAVRSAKQFGKENEAHRNASASKAKGASEDDDTPKTYLPAGTFIRAVLLNGLDAPTGGQAQQNPHPVLLRLVDNAQLPNNFKANLKDCVITANGHGDLSAERAYIRADRLSCIDEDAKSVDVKIAGYVSGEDGKTGVRGRLVTKTGQVLANALYAGIMSSTGEVFKGQGVTSSTNAFGTNQNTVHDPFKVAVGGGVGKAFDELSKYYTRLADKLYPVIEIDGGRVVDVVLSQGVQIQRK